MQVQNPALHTQQTVAQGLTSSSGQQLPTLAMKPALGNSNHPAPSASQCKAAEPAPGTKAGLPEHTLEHLRKGEGGGGSGGGSGHNGSASGLEGRGNPVTRTVTPVTTHPLIAPGESLAVW